MRVLEIQEKLDRGSTSSNGSEEPLTEPEVAILKQMCSVSFFTILLLVHLLPAKKLNGK